MLPASGVTKPYLQGGGDPSFRETTLGGVDEKYRERFQNFRGGGCPPPQLRHCSLHFTISRSADRRWGGELSSLSLPVGIGKLSCLWLFSSNIVDIN